MRFPKEGEMKILGLLVIVVGWLLAVGSVLITSSLTVRFIICIAGISLCLVGILKILNGAYLKDAIWKQ